MNLPCDILYMKDESKQWYLGGLNGIGKNINHTIAFLRREIKNYDKVICIGGSAGGYASILFGSLLEVDAVIAFRPQTDLDYADLPRELHKLKTFKKYNNLNTVINSTTQYFINNDNDNEDKLHGTHHYENISEFSNVNRLDDTVKTMIKNGELEKLLKSLLSSDM